MFDLGGAFAIVAHTVDRPFVHLNPPYMKQGRWPFVYSDAYSLHYLPRRLGVRPLDVAMVKVNVCLHKSGGFVLLGGQISSSTTHAQTCVTSLTLQCFHHLKITEIDSTVQGQLSMK